MRSEKIFFEVKKETKNNALCNLDFYKINDTIIISEYLDSLKKIMENNKFNKKSKLINEYYLINNMWIISGERNIKQEDIYYVKEKFKPSYSTDIKELEYPKNFCFVEKDEKNKLMMESLINFFAINPEDVDVRKIAIINDYIKFICIMIKSAAFFYLENKENNKNKSNNKEKEKFSLIFSIKFNDPNTMEQEIAEISEIGIQSYVNLRSFDNKEPYKLYDINLNQIGILFNNKQNAINPEFSEFNYFPPIKEYSKVHSILICLIHLMKLEELIPKKNYLNNNIEVDFLDNFFKVLGVIKKDYRNFLKNIKSQDKREKIANEYEQAYSIFLVQIQELSKEKNILDDMNLLIKLIILKLQNQLYEIEFGEKIDFDESIIFFNKNDLIQFNSKKTYFQKLFFFGVEISRKCKCNGNPNKYYRLKYYLNFSLNEKDKDSTKIKDLFEKLKKDKCDCGKEQSIKLISLPEYLIITVKDAKKTINTFLDKEIDIKKYCTNDVVEKNKNYYELISFINEDFYPLLKEEKKPIFRQCDGKEININNYKKMPNLLIYKRIKSKK